MRVISAGRFAELLKRAAMNIYQFNTGVVRATDPAGDHRTLVTMPWTDNYGDCIGIGFRTASMGQGVWIVGNYSPARARLIAYQILERCNRLERREPSSKTIDKEEA